jgi:sialate O-acetylesterase
MIYNGLTILYTYQVPLGMISSNWGGTPVQAWSSPDALAKCNQTTEPEKYTQDFFDAESLGSQPGPYTPSVLWNAMIVPFLPTAVSGMYEVL